MTESTVNADTAAPGLDVAGQERADATPNGQELGDQFVADDEQLGELGSPTAPAGAGPVPDELLPAVIESILLVVEEPVPARTIAQVLARTEEDVVAVLDELAAGYAQRGAGIVIRQVAGGYRLYTAAAAGPWVERFLLDGQTARLTQAALETLAVVAYRQPVSRGRVAGVRGVNVDSVFRTLIARGMITEVGTDEDTGAVVYGTTQLFLERLGLSSLEELPDLAPYLPGAEGLDDLDG